MDQLSRTFAALADPTRREILARLADGDATVGDLAEPFPITVQAVSKHLKVLEDAGLITRARSAQTRPSRLDVARLRDVGDWLEKYRELWQSIRALQCPVASDVHRPWLETTLERTRDLDLELLFALQPTQGLSPDF